MGDTEPDPRWPQNVKCPECGRVFNLLFEVDASEWYFGHDCEEVK